MKMSDRTTIIWLSSLLLNFFLTRNPGKSGRQIHPFSSLKPPNQQTTQHTLITHPMGEQTLEPEDIQKIEVASGTSAKANQH